MTGVQTCALPICFPVTIDTLSAYVTQNSGSGLNLQQFGIQIIRLNPPGTSYQTAGVNSWVLSTSRIQNASSGDVTYTGCPFVPTKVWIISGYDGDANYSIGSIGRADLNNLTGYCGYAWNNTGSKTGFAVAAYVVYLKNTASEYQRAVVKSFNQDGVTLTWTGTSTAPWLMPVYMTFER